MRLQIEIQLDRMGDFAIDHSTRSAVPALVGLRRVGGEEADVVALAYHDHGDGRFDVQFSTCSCI